MPKVNMRGMLDRMEVINNRINEIAQTCETEQRERNEREETEYRALIRESQILRMRMQAASNPVAPAPVEDADTLLRDNLNAGRKVTVRLTRAIQTTAALANTGIIPVEQQEMLKPLREGLIYSKVGLNIQTGLKGTLRWPKHGKAVAAWADEAAALTDTNIDFSKLEMTGTRLGIAIPLTREELNDSEGIVERVVREEMPAAIVDKINAAMFATAVSGSAPAGPFVKAAKTPVEFASDVPTRKELIKMKSKVAKTGIQFVAPCWVMTEDMKAELEDTKVDAGSGRFVCENDKILGYPVFTTSAIGEGNIGFGDWSYQAAGFFGSMDLIVDPYTLARKNATDFVLNARFGTVTLRPEAFVLGKKKTTVQGGGQ